jgi:hypothetical protein
VALSSGGQENMSGIHSAFIMEQPAGIMEQAAGCPGCGPERCIAIKMPEMPAGT